MTKLSVTGTIRGQRAGLLGFIWNRKHAGVSGIQSVLLVGKD